MKRIATIGTLLAAATTFGLAGCSGGGSGTGAGIAPPPLTAQADSFALAANLPAATIPAAIGVLANDPAGATIVASDAQSLLGGTVTVNPDGSFTFEPAAGVTGTDTFNYSVDSNGDISSATVTVDLTAKAIFVDPAAAADGDGHHASPRNTLTAALAAAANGDTVFVKAGDGTALNGGLTVTLKPGMKLIGEAAGLSVEVKDGEWVEVLAPSVVDPLDPAPPAIYPRLETTIDLITGNTVAMADGSELAGFSLQSLGVVDRGLPTAEGVATVSAGSITDFKIHGNVIADPSGPAIEVSHVNGKGVITNNTISGLTGEHAGVDLFFRNVSSSTAQLNISGNTIEAVDGELASAIGMLVRTDPGDPFTHDISLVMDGNTVRGGRGLFEEAPGVFIAMPDVALEARGGGGPVTVCAEVTNNVSSTPPGIYEAGTVGGATFQLADNGNDAAVTATGTIPVASCQ